MKNNKSRTISRLVSPVIEFKIRFYCWALLSSVKVSESFVLKTQNWSLHNCDVFITDTTLSENY